MTRGQTRRLRILSRWDVVTLDKLETKFASQLFDNAKIQVQSLSPIANVICTPWSCFKQVPENIRVLVNHFR